jgi:hypothetical protein
MPENRPLEHQWMWFQWKGEWACVALVLQEGKEALTWRKSAMPTAAAHSLTWTQSHREIRLPPWLLEQCLKLTTSNTDYLSPNLGAHGISLLLSLPSPVNPWDLSGISTSLPLFVSCPPRRSLGSDSSPAFSMASQQPPPITQVSCCPSDLSQTGTWCVTHDQLVSESCCDVSSPASPVGCLLPTPSNSALVPWPNSSVQITDGPWTHPSGSRLF